MTTGATMENNKVHEAICAVMQEMEAVGKTRKNQGQNYQYRGIADIYQALQKIMAKHGLHVSPIKIGTPIFHETAKGKHLTFVTTYRITHIDGSFQEGEAVCEASDFGDKACNKAMSAGMKYWLIQNFCIPEEDPAIDTEYDGAEPVTAKEQPKTQEPKQPLQKPASTEAVKEVRDMAIDSGIAATELIPYVTEVLQRKIRSSKDIMESDIITLKTAIIKRVQEAIANEEK